MGQAKTDGIECEERGWNDSNNKFVCSNCVKDDFLKNIVLSKPQKSKCSYCGQQCAAPLEVLIPVVLDAIYYCFNDPLQSGKSNVDGDEPVLLETSEVLEELDFVTASQDLLTDVSTAIHIEEWIPAAQGHWSTFHEHEILGNSWNEFERIVKYVSRFNFASLTDDDEDHHEKFAPKYFLPRLGHLVKSKKMTRTISKDTNFYRARVQNKNDTWAINCESLGAPPPHLVSAGRMNPEGIPYLYLALEEKTVLAETLSEHSTAVAVATFRAARELKVIDLTNPPQIPSIFDKVRHQEREELLFLNSFVNNINKHVDHASKQIDYIPTQIVSEYFSQVFLLNNKPDDKADGLIYKSAKCSGGVNLVLFPRVKSRSQNSFDVVCCAEVNLKIVSAVTLKFHF